MTPVHVALALIAAEALGGDDATTTRTPGRSYRGRAGDHTLRVRRHGEPWAWSVDAGAGTGTASSASDAIVAALQHVSPLGDTAEIRIEALDDSGTAGELGPNDAVPSSSAVSAIAVWRSANGWQWAASDEGAIKSGQPGTQVGTARSRGAALLAALEAWAKAGIV